jgi:Uri superfamily endonuclease
LASVIIFSHADRQGKAGTRTSKDIECALAAGLQKIADWSIPRLGCSGCSSKNHRFDMDNDPVKAPYFIKTLYNYKIKSLEEELKHASH